jgi:hypothetical protein
MSSQLGCELLGKQALEYIAAIPRLQRLQLSELPQIMTLNAIAVGLPTLRELRIGDMASLIGVNLVQRFHQQQTNAKHNAPNPLVEGANHVSPLEDTLCAMTENPGDDGVMSIPIPSDLCTPDAEIANALRTRPIDTLHDFGRLTQLTSLVLCPNSRVCLFIIFYYFVFLLSFFAHSVRFLSGHYYLSRN